MTVLSRLAFGLGALAVLAIVAGIVGPLLRAFTFSPAPVVPIAAAIAPAAFVAAYVLRELRDLR